MKKILTTLLVLAPFVGQTQAAVVNSGFDITNPSNSLDLGILDGPGAFDSYVQGVGAGRPLAGGVATATWNSGPTTASGGPVDLLGWSSAPGKGNPDTGKNGVGGSSGLNIFAAWGAQQRVIGATTDTVAAGTTYTLTAQIDGSVLTGGVVLDLMANGVVLPSTGSITPVTDVAGFDLISRTYDITTLPGGVSAGDDLTVLLGVPDSNGVGGRMIWDDVTLTAVAAVPEPSSALLLSLGGLALMLRRRK